MILLLAWRYAFSPANKHRGVSRRIALGLGISILAILVTISFMQALQKAQFDQIRTYESFDLHSRQTYSLEDGRALAAFLTSLPGVEEAFVYQDLPVLLLDEQYESHPMRIRGIDIRPGFAVQHVAGDLDLALSYRNRFFGSDVALTFLRSGKQVTQVPTHREVSITGLYATRLGEFDQTTILSKPEYLTTLTGSDRFTIGIYASDGSMKVAERSLAEYDFITYKEANQSLYQAMELEQKMMGLLLFVLVLIIIVHIHISSKRLVGSRQREIALLRTLGLENREITAVFVTQGLIVASLGCVLGLLFTKGFFFLYPFFSPYILSNLGLTLHLTLRGGEVAALLTLILVLAALSSYTGSRDLTTVDIMEIIGHAERF